MAKITNNAEGARGVLLADGTTHYVEPGQTVDLDVAKGHELYEGLSSGRAAASDEPKALSAMNKAELLDVAQAEGVEIETDDNKADLIAKIEAKRAAA